MWRSQAHRLVKRPINQIWKCAKLLFLSVPSVNLKCINMDDIKSYSNNVVLNCRADALSTDEWENKTCLSRE